MSLSVEPARPAKGKPFQIIARGGGEGSEGLELDVFFTDAKGCPGRDAMAADSRVVRLISRNNLPEPFDVRGTYSGGTGKAYDLDAGVRSGRYQACGYITQPDGGNLVLARLQFGVGASCQAAVIRVYKAVSALNKASKALKRARRSYRRNGSSRNFKRLKAAKRKARKVEKTLKRARSDRRLLCSWARS